MDDLIKRLEAASEGSRELSDAVLVASGWTIGRSPEDWWLKPSGAVCAPGRRPDPTRDLHAAVSLIPEGWWWSLQSPQGFVPYDKAVAEIMPPDQSAKSFKGDAATEPLAVCIAALRARANPHKKGTAPEGTAPFSG